MDIDIFWNRIKKLCKEKGFTQKELSAKAGGEPRMIESQIFKKVIPNVDEVYNIAQLLDTTVEYLVTGEEPNAELCNNNVLQEKLNKIKEVINS